MSEENQGAMRAIVREELVAAALRNECGTAPWKKGELLEFAVPLLFGLLMFALIRQHSWEPWETLPGIVSAVAAVSSFIIALLSWRCRRVALPRSLLLPLLALGASIAVSTAGSSDLAASLLRLSLYLSVSLLAVATYLLYRDAPRIPLAWFCMAIAAVQVPFLVDVVIELREIEGEAFASVPNFSNVRHFGHIGFLAAAGGIGAVALSTRLRMLAFVLTCAALFGICATGSRAALLAWMVFVALLIGFSQVRGRVAACGLGALVLSAALVWFLHDSGLLLSPSIFVRLEQNLAGDGFDSGRLMTWQAALREIGGQPSFGQGPEAYWLSGCCFTAVRHPHNFVLQLLMEFGVVGCTLLMLLAWRAVELAGGFRRLVRRILLSAENVVLAAAISACLALGLVDGTLYFAVPLLHIAVFSGLLVAGLRRVYVPDSAASFYVPPLTVKDPRVNR